MSFDSPAVVQPLDVPQAWIESVNDCPVCSSHERESLAMGVRDINYGCVSGEWNFFRCNRCGSAFLDPRIDQMHISQAYAKYETHALRPGVGKRGGANGFFRRITDAYMHRRYGCPARGPSLLLALLVYLLPPTVRLEWDFAMRHAGKSRGRRVLDVGCGNGDFLLRMQIAGWHAKGIDFDPLAVATARSRGLDVDLAAAHEESESGCIYDLVAASHVVEHVHDPAGFLRDLYARVAPGGRLWLATPNIDSPLRRREGEYWNNWETPRHLQMFTVRSLSNFIETTLGTKPRFRRRGWHMYWSMAQSRRLREGNERGERPTLPGRLMPLVWCLEAAALISPRWGDELVVEISKPLE